MKLENDHLTPEDFFEFIDQGGGSGPVGQHLLCCPECLFELDFLLLAEAPATAEEGTVLKANEEKAVGHTYSGLRRGHDRHTLGDLNGPSQIVDAEHDVSSGGDVDRVDVDASIRHDQRHVAKHARFVQNAHD